MNQILVSEKLYITPELKKKKKLFKIEFVLSVFFLCVLSTYAIYAEYDRNKSEEVSQDILGGISFAENKKTEVEKSIVVILNREERDEKKVETITEQKEVEVAVPKEQEVNVGRK